MKKSQGLTLEDTMGTPGLSINKFLLKKITFKSGRKPS